MDKKIEFMPIDYDYFDYNGKNYMKITGRSDNGKRVCLIDSCDVYFWAILKDKVKSSRIEKIRHLRRLYRPKHCLGFGASLTGPASHEKIHRTSHAE